VRWCRETDVISRWRQTLVVVVATAAAVLCVIETRRERRQAWRCQPVWRRRAHSRRQAQITCTPTPCTTFTVCSAHTFQTLQIPSTSLVKWKNLSYRRETARRAEIPMEWLCTGGHFIHKNRDFWSIYNWLESDMLDVLHCTYFPESCTIRLEYDHTQISVSSKFRQMTLDQWGVLHKNSRFSSNISLGTSIGTCMRSIKWWYCRWTPVTVAGLNSSLIITKGPNGHLQCYAVWQCSNNHWIYHKTFSGKNTAYPYMYEDNCNDRTSWNATISAVVFDRKDCLRLYSWSSNLMFHRTSRREAARCMPRVCQ